MDGRLSKVIIRKRSFEVRALADTLLKPKIRSRGLNGHAYAAAILNPQDRKRI